MLSTYRPGTSVMTIGHLRGTKTINRTGETIVAKPERCLTPVRLFQEMIQAKVNGEELVQSEVVEEAKPVDIMDALKASIEKAEDQREMEKVTKPKKKAAAKKVSRPRKQAART